MWILKYSNFSDPDNNQDSTPPSSSSSVRPPPPPPSIPPSARSSRGYNEIPMPTLYNGSDGSSHSGHPDGQGRNMGAMGTILYNMASILAGVAVGYDVRLSNVSPIHPKLYPKRWAKKIPVFCSILKKVLHKVRVQLKLNLENEKWVYE